VWLICAVLAGLTFAVFAQTLRHDFVNYDDDLYVYQNPIVRRGLTLHGAAWAFAHGYSSNWHPVTWLSHMLDCQIYGLHPAGHHFTSVLLHIANVLALFLLLRRLTSRMWPSAFVAAVFAVHPLRVESVAWVAERKDVLSGFFFLLTLAAYAKYARQPAVWCYALTATLLALGLMCKPMLVTTPLVLLLLDYWPLQRRESWSRLLLEKVPLLALSAATGMVTLAVQNSAVHAGGAFAFDRRVGHAIVACLIYLKQMFWPVCLAAPYPLPPSGPSGWEIALAIGVLGAISIGAWKMRRAQPWLGVGWLWFLIMLLPVLGLIQVGRQAHADRYTYLPQIGLYFALTWLAASWKWPRALAGAVMISIVASLALDAWKQTAYWQNSETWWEHTLACTTDNETAHVNLGQAFAANGRTSLAEEQYRDALRINSNNVEANNNLADQLLQVGRVNDAIGLCQHVIAIRPDFPKAHFNLARAYAALKKWDDARAELAQAVELDPADVDAQNMLGILLRQAGRLDEAIAHYRAVAEILPDNKSIHVNLAIALLQKGDVPAGLAEYRRAEALDPNDVEVANNLAWQLATAPNPAWRQGSEALALARRADQLTSGNNAVVRGTLAAALAETGQFNEAAQLAQAAIALAERAGQAELARRLRAQMSLYQSGQPYHRP
jgi:tetratricopeptide (TPR) repeat protein